MGLHLPQSDKADSTLYGSPLLLSEVAVLKKLAPPLMILPELYKNNGGQLLTYSDNLLEDNASD